MVGLVGLVNQDLIVSYSISLIAPLSFGIPLAAGISLPLNAIVAVVYASFVHFMIQVIKQILKA